MSWRRAERPGVVAGALRGDLEAVRRGRTDHVADLVGVDGEGDGGGPLVDGDVPRHPRGVVPGVAGQLDADGGVTTEGVGSAGGRGGLDGHDVSPR